MVLKTLNKLLGRDGGDERPSMRAAVFGKHPGWSDHMEEIGLSSVGLVELRRALYSEGIARIVDGGDWESMDDDERLETFDHAFVRRWKGSLIIGRLWSSEDGRGRKKYPMIVAVESDGLPAARAIAIAAPACARAQAAFRATSEADAVRSAYADLQRALDKAVVNETRSPEPAGRHVRALQAMAASASFAPEGGSPRDGVYRVMHTLDTELGAQLGVVGGSSSGSWSARARQVSDRGGHVRGPSVGESHGPEGGSLSRGSSGAGGSDVAGASLRTWMDLVEPLTGGRLSMLVTVSPAGADGRAWVDVIAGESGASALTCLRANDRHTPMASEVPYEVPAETRGRVDDILGSSASGATGASDQREESP